MQTELIVDSATGGEWEEIGAAIRASGLEDSSGLRRHIASRLCESPKLEHPPLRSLSEVQAEREQRDLQMKLDNPAGHRLDLYPIWKCPCGRLNQYADTFGEICLRCGTDHTLDWQRFICEIGLSSSHLANPAYSAPVPDGLERICGAFASAKGDACPLPMFHEGDCPIDED